MKIHSLTITTLMNTQRKVHIRRKPAGSETVRTNRFQFRRKNILNRRWRKTITRTLTTKSHLWRKNSSESRRFLRMCMRNPRIWKSRSNIRLITRCDIPISSLTCYIMLVLNHQRLKTGLLGLIGSKLRDRTVFINASGIDLPENRNAKVVDSRDVLSRHFIPGTNNLLVGRMFSPFNR